MTKLESLKKQYKKALARLGEVLAKEKSDIMRDSSIQRFEFTFDLSWKLVKAYLEDRKGIKCASPKDCFREAYKVGLIDYDDRWIKITDWRNQVVHTYSEEFADKVYEKLPQILELFKDLQEGVGE